MGSLDPRRCATPQAVAKTENGTARGRTKGGKERSGRGGSGSGPPGFSGRLHARTAPGSGGRSGRLWWGSEGPAKGFQAGATGGAGGKRLFHGTELSGAVAGRRQERRRKRNGGAWNDGFREGLPIRLFRAAGGLRPAGRICQAAPTGAEPGRCGCPRRKGSAPRSRRVGKVLSPTGWL